ncbi:MAG: biosynthetic arginine decarboxylase, partial [Candidatus Eisenbacteria bacterium]|nr:biosynthetic arginine decarboxylase [Candidatus Eisenbacteria bacterium]
MESTIRRMRALYGTDNWGQGYFDINRSGRLVVLPDLDETEADVWEIYHEARRRGLNPPLLLRFPQILDNQVSRLYEAFDKSRREFSYSAPYRIVYPLKVNSQRFVVEEILRTAKDSHMGIEVGSKAELYLALGLELAPGSLVVCNGFKDASSLRLAVVGAQMDLDVVVVLERLEDLRLLEGLGDDARKLWVGLRGRLYSRGAGKWEATGGTTGKFGLSPPDLVHALRVLQDRGLESRLAMLHFHLGSQVTDIRRVKAAVKEAARVYAKVHKLGFPVRWLNVGGGLGVDYDGSGSTADSSANYALEEYANDIVFNTREICEHEGVPLPHLASESGRALTAHHAVLLLEAAAREGAPDPPVGTGQREHPLMAELEETRRIINPKNFREYYHDALQEREELQSLFELGYLSLEARARAEAAFRDICRKALEFARAADAMSEEFERLQRALRASYVANFSVFRSIPDAWAVQQLFPVMPIHRLDEEPDELGILMDLT